MTTNPAALAAGVSPGTADRMAPAATGPVRFLVRNGGAETFRVAAPIEPSALVVRWRPLPEGAVTGESARALLPIALAAGEAGHMDVVLRAPERPGRYEVDVALADTPDLVIARAQLEVGA